MDVFPVPPEVVAAASADGPRSAPPLRFQQLRTDVTGGTTALRTGLAAVVG
ncbi:hypothetical protein ACIQUQ_27970 [Streptomyces sp. NPDC101118]|uniref:hypothetical protein n=1 Tax=Streptomyces sp. NPDC101118 TaxID=3366109 RepID=UPI00382B9AB7